MAHWRSTLSSQSGSQLGSNTVSSNSSSINIFSSSNTSSSSNSSRRRGATASSTLYTCMATAPSFLRCGGDLVIHISCSSDKVLFNGREKAAGMLLWSCNDAKGWSFGGRSYMSGYTIVKNIANIPGATCASRDGSILAKLHTALVGSTTSCRIHTTGFVYNRGMISWTSGTLDSSTGQWSSTRPIGSVEKDAILEAYEDWVRTGRKESRFACRAAAS
eukprot:scpid96896/ scgid13670/ 